MTCQPAVPSSLQHTDVLDIWALTHILYLIVLVILEDWKQFLKHRNLQEVQHVDINPEPPTHYT